MKLDYLHKQKEFILVKIKWYVDVRGNTKGIEIILLREQKTNPSKFWSFIKKLGGEDRGNLPDTVQSPMLRASVSVSQQR